ncbi:MAG: hypothetical protein ACOX61_00070 [Brooklawnia sp.]|jgi:hypothetical protein
MTGAHGWNRRRSWLPAAACLAVLVALGACATPQGSEPGTSPSGSGAAPSSATASPPPERGITVVDSELTASERLTSESEGQVIELLEIRGGIRIVHDNVTVRNVRILHESARQGEYAVLIAHKDDGQCPASVVVENIEVIGDREVLAPGTKAVYGRCPFTLRSSIVHHAASGVRITDNTTIENNDILADHWVAGDDAHRSGIGLNGGAHNVIRGNTIVCEGEGCSAALSMYGDFAQVDDVLVEGNTLATNGSYCVYGGSLTSKPYPVAQDVRIINNTFSRQFFPTCGRYGPVAGVTSGGGPGFMWEGNTWDDTGGEVALQ